MLQYCCTVSSIQRCNNERQRKTFVFLRVFRPIQAGINFAYYKIRL